MASSQSGNSKKGKSRKRERLTDKQIVIAKNAAALATKAAKLSRELCKEDIKVTKFEVLVPTAVLDHSISDFVAAGADGLNTDGDIYPNSDAHSDWPGS